MIQIEEILDFWFGQPGTEEAAYAHRRKFWFIKSSHVDQTICDRFLTVYEQAAAGDYDLWEASPQGTLALIIVLDQFPRNMFRQKPRAFATDSKALAIAKKAIAKGFDQILEPIQRLFIYLPFEHSEHLSDQEESVKLVQALCAVSSEFGDCLDYAIRHRDVIARFGRFPHRNAILNRSTTSEEALFLQERGSSF
jgi:uncharacterized protein (DUF924 family)